MTARCVTKYCPYVDGLPRVKTSKGWVCLACLFDEARYYNLMLVSR